MQLIGLFSAALGEPNQELETSQDIRLETQQETEPEGGPETKPEKDPETKPDRSLEKLEGGLEAKPEKDPETNKLGGYGKVRSLQTSPLASRAVSPSPGVTRGVDSIHKIDDVIFSVSEKSQDTQLETQQETKLDGGPEAKPEKDPETRSGRNLD